MVEENELILTERLFKIRNVFRKQEAAATIVVTGPSGSGKSYSFTMLLPDTSNRLMARNVGDKQTSLIKTLLMLNEDLPENEVILRFKIKPFDPLLIKAEMTEALIDFIYDNREDLEETEINDELVQRILDPQDRAYHFQTFVSKKNEEGILEFPKVDDLKDRLQNLFALLIDGLREEVRELEKASKAKHPKPKRRDFYEQILNARLDHRSENEIKSLYEWFQHLYSFIKDEILQACGNQWLDEEYMILEGRVDSIQEKGPFTESTDLFHLNFISSNPLERLVLQTYDSASPYSLVVEELAYVVAPSEEFQKAFAQAYPKDKYPGKKLKLNILDTPGLTQVGEEKQDIENALEHVLGLRFDALLFLCSADEGYTVYEICKELLIKKKKQVEKFPKKILRTRADLLLYSRMKNQRMLRKGNASFQDREESATDAKLAFDSFINDIEKEKDQFSNVFSNESLVDFIGLDPYILNNVTDYFTDISMGKEKLFEILLTLSREVLDSYQSPLAERLWLEGIDKSAPVLESNMDRYMKVILESFSKRMVDLNEKEGRHFYLMYADQNKVYHSRSAQSFLFKHRGGNGHETQAMVYDNFKVHIRSMIQKWLLEYFRDWDLKFDISFNVGLTEAGKKVVNEAGDQLLHLFNQNKGLIIYHIAKSLSYDALRDEMEAKYYFTSWNQGFQENLCLFHSKFSSQKYWEDGLRKYLKKELDQLLDRMYFYE